LVQRNCRSIFVSQPHFESAIQLKNTASIGISDNPRISQGYDAGELLSLKRNAMCFLARLLVGFGCLLSCWQCYCVVILLLAVLLAWLWIFMLAEQLEFYLIEE